MVLFCKGVIVVMGVGLRQFSLNMNVGWEICLFRVGLWFNGLLWGVLFWSDVR